MLLLLLTDGSTSNVSSIPDADIFSQLLSPILYFFIVCGLAYYVTKWISSMKGVKGRNQSLSICNTLSVGYQKNLQIIKVGERFFLLAVTKDNINFISEISKNDLALCESSDPEIIKKDYDKADKNLFNKYLKNYISKSKKPDEANSNEK